MNGNRVWDKNHSGSSSGYRLLMLGLNMRLVFVGASLCLVGVVSLVEVSPGVSALMASTWIAAGSTLAHLAWQRTAAILDKFDTGHLGNSVHTKLPSSRKGAGALESR
jgi:hypothetical protein